MSGGPGREAGASFFPVANIAARIVNLNLLLHSPERRGNYKIGNELRRIPDYRPTRQVAPAQQAGEYDMTQPIRAGDCEVAMIGAGPYGLAATAHLRSAGVFTHAFGEAMAFWRANMPKGMRLRSAWHASHISDPERKLSLDAYARLQTTERRDNVPLADFVGYGEWFQARAVPDLDRRRVTRIDARGRGFSLLLEDGEQVQARRVVVATGLANQDFRPAPFAGMPAALVSHTSEHADLAHFRGLRVAVIGRGQSACESAVLLSEAGADVDLISRGPVHWVGSQRCADPVGSTPVWHPNKMLIAPSGVGPFPLNWLNEAPGLVHRLPSGLRRALIARSTRAGAAAWLIPRLNGVRLEPGRNVVGARLEADRIMLQLDNGSRAFEHVLLATGYKTDLARLGLFDASLLAAIAQSSGAPLLSAGFESSVPGMHFIGAAAIASFGALNRFVAGCGYAARAVTRAVLADRGRVRLRGRQGGRPGLLSKPEAASQ